MNGHDGVSEEAGDADDLATGWESFEPIFDRIREDQFLDRAVGDLGGRPA
jgi:hypothetical protein